MIGRISELIKNFKLLRWSESLSRYEHFKSIEFYKMDEYLLGTLIRHYAHILDKLTKNRWIENRTSIYYYRLIEAIKSWQEKKFGVTDDILWAESIIEKYRLWEKEKKPIRSLCTFEKKEAENIYNIIKQRRSIRLFEKKDIDHEDIISILDAGRWAPCSGNRQAWKFIVQKRTKNSYIAKKDLSFENEGWRRGSVMIYVAIDERLYPEKYTAAMDSAAAIQNMLLMAHYLNLGGCWMYMSELTDQQKLRKKLEVEDYYYIYSVILLGYPAECPKEPCRKPFEKTIKFIGFDPNQKS